MLSRPITRCFLVRDYAVLSITYFINLLNRGMEELHAKLGPVRLIAVMYYGILTDSSTEDKV